VGTPSDAHPGMTGIALWRDGEIWHLRASEAGPDRAVFAGKVETDGVIKYVRRHLEGGDVTARAGRHDVGYRFTNYGRVDGIDFTVKCGAHLKITSNLEEIKARDGIVIAVATEGDGEIGTVADFVIPIPPSLEWLQPLLVAVPLQLLAYHLAVLRGCDVDQPRNLAKSVTVE
jgi:hypothetical protein